MDHRGERGEADRRGITDVVIEPHDEALVEMIRDIGNRLLATEVLAAIVCAAKR